jgi:hypothetical protein
MAALLLTGAACVTTTLPENITPAPTFTFTAPAAPTLTSAPPAAAATTPQAQPPPTLPPSPMPSATPSPESPLRFAVIGDYGSGEAPEARVAELVISWQPEFILTVGDNNYPSGAAETIDAHIGQYYHDYIYLYHGAYGEGADRLRFFPTLGNHDWDTPGAQAYLDYFELPGNERYYDFVWGPMHFFALDSDSREPDGVGSSSTQAEWLRLGLEGSTAPWQIVYMHHAPYSSGQHGPVEWARWPYALWGADAALAGHDHTYERLEIDGIPYFVNGLGGGAIYGFVSESEGSQARFNSQYGAMLVEATAQRIHFQFITVEGERVDEFELDKP